MEEVPPGYVAVGRVAAAWGVGGVVKVVPLVDRRERLASGRGVTVGGEHRIIESSRWREQLLYLKLSGIDSRDAAAALRQRLLLVPESDLEPLPEGQYYHFQLIGLAVYGASGVPLGRVIEVRRTGANDVYIVEGESGEILIPATDAFVREVDLEGGRIVIEEVPGLIPDTRKGR